MPGGIAGGAGPGRATRGKVRGDIPVLVAEIEPPLADAMDSEEVDDSDESFVLGDPAGDGLQQQGKVADDRPEDPAGDDWCASEAYRLVGLKGGADCPGNYWLGVPKWISHYFQDPEKAIVFAAIVYWFLPGRKDKPRATRRDKAGRVVLDKTHRQLADEVGIQNIRRVEKLLRAFKDEGLLDYDPNHGVGAGRTTRIWLKPAGVLKAYHQGSRRAREIEEGT